jgi:hypothetical protein
VPASSVFFWRPVSCSLHVHLAISRSRTYAPASRSGWRLLLAIRGCPPSVHLARSRTCAHDKGRMTTNGMTKGLCRAPFIARTTNPFVVRQRRYTAKKGLCRHTANKFLEIKKTSATAALTGGPSWPASSPPPPEFPTSLHQPAAAGAPHRPPPDCRLHHRGSPPLQLAPPASTATAAAATAATRPPSPPLPSRPPAVAVVGPSDLAQSVCLCLCVCV